MWVEAVAVAPDNLQEAGAHLHQHLRAKPGMDHLGAVALGTSAGWQGAGRGRYRYTEGFNFILGLLVIFRYGRMESHNNCITDILILLYIYFF